MTQRHTFDACARTITDLKQAAEPDCVILLVGNKIDLVENNEKARMISQEEAKQFACDNKLFYIETSAAKKYKVADAYEKLLHRIVD